MKLNYLLSILLSVSSLGIVASDNDNINVIIKVAPILHEREIQRETLRKNIFGGALGVAFWGFASGEFLKAAAKPGNFSKPIYNNFRAGGLIGLSMGCVYKAYQSAKRFVNPFNK